MKPDASKEYRPPLPDTNQHPCQPIINGVKSDCSEIEQDALAAYGEPGMTDFRAGYYAGQFYAAQHIRMNLPSL